MKSQLFNFHDVVLVLCIAEAILLAIVIPTIPTRNRLASSLLSGLLLMLAGMLAMNIVMWNSELRQTDLAQSLLSMELLIICVLLQGPLLFFYRQSLRGEAITLSAAALHLFPMIVAMTVALYCNIDGSNFIGALETKLWNVEFSLFAILKVTPMIYVALCLWQSNPIKRWLRGEPTNAENDDPRAWEFRLSSFVLGGFLLHWTWSTFSFLGGHFFSWSVSVADTLGILNNYLAVILVNLLVAFGVIHLRNSATLVQQKPNKKIPQEKIDPIVSAIDHTIKLEKIYLKSDLNLERFCEHLGYTEREVSFVINSKLNVNFFEFINRYRVDEAKRLLSSPEHQDKTILDIIYMSGFNSQSAFHRFFKRFSDMTPSQYRKAFKNAA